jgi:RNA polymerase sigma-70 factor (ECF subfamily)
MTPWRTPPKVPRSSKASAARNRHLHAAVRALITAWDERSIPLIRLALRSDATLLIDGGGSIPAPVQPIRGAAAVASELMAMLSAIPDVELSERDVNALPSIVMGAGGRVVGVISLMISRRRISAIWVVLNPDKLTHWNAR